MKKLIVVIILCLISVAPTLAEETVTEDVMPSDNPEVVQPAVVNFNRDNPQYQLQGGVSFDNDDGTVFLDKKINRPILNVKPANTLIPVYTPSANSYDDTYARTRSALAGSSKLSGEEYYIEPTSHYLEEQAGHFSYGSYYGTSLDSAQLLYSTQFYTRYDTKHFAFTGGFGTDSGSTNGANTNMFSIAPEWKITKTLAVRDTIKTYMGLPVKKNQISSAFRYYLDF